MGAFLVELPESASGTRRASKMLVSANAAGDAKDICKSRYSGDAGNAAWESATVTEITDKAASAADSMNGWRFQVLVNDTAGDELVNVTVTGITSTLDTLDKIGTELAVQLNLHASIAGAGYTVGTQALIVALGSGGDDLGDHTVVCNVMAPLVLDANNRQDSSDFSHNDAFVSAVTDGGSATDNLDITFNADATLVPVVFAEFL